MSGELRFEGKTVIITGAGRNLGREYALLLASRGANVVVNDLGVGISDTDGSATAPVSNPADDVVAEIVAAGGSACANYDSIATTAGGEAIVHTAIEHFGAVDVVVNNAGQVRMVPFGDFPDEHIDTLLDTQLRGALNVSRPAWRFMAERGGGRIINVSSGAAFGGVPNGSVYGMTKMGVIGLTRGMAAEGKSLGITVNVIAPYAKTRPETGFGPFGPSDELNEWLHPKRVAPLVGWLAHESCTVTGECFSVGAGHFARVSLVMSAGLLDRDATIETLAASVDQIMDGQTSAVTAFSSRAVPTMMKDFRPPASS